MKILFLIFFWYDDKNGDFYDKNGVNIIILLENLELFYFYFGLKFWKYIYIYYIFLNF